MNAWRLFLVGTVILILTGVGLSLIEDKGFFLKWMAGQRQPLTDYFFYHVTKLGEPPGFIIIGLILWLRSWRRMVLIPVLGGFVTLLTYVLKKFFYHERPLLYLNRTGWDGPMAVFDYHINTGHSSFPSGHAMAAWALFTLTAVLIRKNWVSMLCLFLAASVSLSRVYLMVHFLKDVVAGAALGFAIGYAFYYMYTRWLEKEKTQELFDPTAET